MNQVRMRLVAIPILSPMEERTPLDKMCKLWADYKPEFGGCIKAKVAKTRQGVIKHYMFSNAGTKCCCSGIEHENNRDKQCVIINNKGFLVKCKVRV